ncbi:uncharacterized protein LOC114459080 [Gouania willdenowi]|uniref:uncharacterized protein LOC114459080 n=1 Tax=Gouania willdenowi TaxID=441366 RepID=UPI0010566D70|nr:uncharacterized protein LOC114459080 [Gouania willdenowi]
MLIQVRYCQQQKYVKVNDVDGQFDFMEFHEKVIERFCMPPDAKVVYKDTTGTEVDEDIFSDLVSQGSLVLTAFSNDGFSDSSLSSPSEWSESSFSSSASTILLDEVPRKKSRVEGIINAASAKKLIETLLETSSGGKEVLEEYHTTQTLTDATSRKLVNIIVAHMIDKHGHIPTKAVREEYALGIVTVFPSLKDPYYKKGYVNQDFTLLFDDEVSTRLLQKWDSIFRSNVIKEAKQLTSTPELRELVQSAESQPGSAGGPKSPKISASDAVKKLVVFHKSCCSLEEHLRNQQCQQPHLLAVGRQKRNIDSFYISMDKHLIPCQANHFIGAFDELFKAHFVFNVSYDRALVHFYTFLQTTVYNIDMGKMKESPRVRDMRAKLLTQEVLLTTLS